MEQFLQASDNLFDLTISNFLAVVIFIIAGSGLLWLYFAALDSGKKVTAWASGKSTTEVLRVGSGKVFFGSIAAVMLLTALMFVTGLCRSISATLTTPPAKAAATDSTAATPIAKQIGDTIALTGAEPGFTWFRVPTGRYQLMAVEGSSEFLFLGQDMKEPVAAKAESGIKDAYGRLEVFGIKSPKPIKLRLLAQPSPV